MTNFLDRLRLGILAFKEAYLTSPLVSTHDWASQDARAVRYSILWAMYEQTSYRDVHSWAVAMRKQYALYKYIRPVYNPAYRLAEFWKSHLFGGALDPTAGPEGAIPLSMDEGSLPGLQDAIANLWRWSRWNVRKDILTTRGTVLGDSAIRVVDDVSRGQVYLELLHPGMIDEIERDPFGNVKGYTLKEMRDDPRGKGGLVTYGERVTRSGDNVVYETFLDGKPYAWDGNTDRLGQAKSTWSEPYTFVPLVVIQHHDVGLDFGYSELHPIRAKVQEADDLASMVSDGIRKVVNPKILFMGTKRPTSGVIALSGARAATSSTGATNSDRPAPGREELEAIFLGKDGKTEILAPNMDLAGVLEHIDNILKEIERDAIELAPDMNTASGDASGRALRVARQPVVSKVIQRRANYDAGMVTANQMAISIGGLRGYDGYDGFDIGTYKTGGLAHHVLDRPVFDEDPLDKIEIDAAFWAAAAAAQTVGISLPGYLKNAGWTDEQISELGPTDTPKQEETDG